MPRQRPQRGRDPRLRRRADRRLFGGEAAEVGPGLNTVSESPLWKDQTWGGGCERGTVSGLDATASVGLVEPAQIPGRGG